MAGSVLIVSNESPADVYGSHGGTSVVQWKRLAVAGFFDGVLDSMDYNRVGPGSMIGLHQHRVTEEIYFVVSGSAEMLSPTESRRIGPGDVTMLGRGGVHGLRNDTDEPMEFLVFEGTPPSTLRALYEGDATTPDPDRSALSYAHADVGRPVRLSDYLNSAWGELRVEELSEGQSARFDSDELEYAIYVLNGAGRVSLPEGDEAVAAGTAVVFTRWTAGDLMADKSLRYVVAETKTDSPRSEKRSARGEE